MTPLDVSVIDASLMAGEAKETDIGLTGGSPEFGHRWQAR